MSGWERKEGHPRKHNSPDEKMTLLILKRLTLCVGNQALLHFVPKVLKCLFFFLFLCDSPSIRSRSLLALREAAAEEEEEEVWLLEEDGAGLLRLPGEDAEAVFRLRSCSCSISLRAARWSFPGPEAAAACLASAAAAAAAARRWDLEHVKKK